MPAGYAEVAGDGLVSVRRSLPCGAQVVIDEADLDLLEHHTWWTTQGYATSRIDGEFVYLHRIILSRKLGRPLRKDEITDHINCKRLDDRRPNLRIVTPRQSMMNRRKRQGTSSRYLGVSYVSNKHKRRKRWRATIKINGKQKTLGYFGTEEEAAQARDKAVKKHYGEYARLNNV